MKPTTILIIIMLVLAMMMATLAMPVEGAVPGDPYPIHGTVKDESGAVGSGATVRVTNKETGEYVTDTTVSDGSYVADLNFASGWDDGDRLEVKATYGSKIAWSNITIDVSGQSDLPGSTVNLQFTAAKAVTVEEEAATSALLLGAGVLVGIIILAFLVYALVGRARTGSWGERKTK